MNFSEYFYLKTKPCTNMINHNYDSCYFYHDSSIINDLRRPLLDLTFFLNTKKKKDYKIIELQMYSKEITIDEKLDKVIYNMSPCLNSIEHKYHINNYKMQICFFEVNNIPCQYGKFCYYYHKNEKIDDEIKNFCEFYNETNKTTFVKKRILNYWNNLINSEKTSNSLKENSISIKTKNNIQDFTSKKKNLMSIINQETPINKNLDRENSISKDLHNQSIYKELKKIQSIKIGQNIFGSMPKNNEILYISDESPKEEELIKVIFAFLNSHSGNLIFGVEKTRFSYKGFKMNRKEREWFKQEFNSRLKNYLNFETSIKYKFFDLVEGEKLIEDFCVLYIKVRSI